MISRAENQRKHRKKKRQAWRAFYSNPYAFAKKLFVESKSGKLDVPKEELENHLKMTYSDDLNGIPIPHLRDLPKPQDPTVMFDDSGIKPKEVRNFVHKARAGSAPGLNGISYKLYKNCPRVLRKLTILLQQAWKKAIVPQEWCLADGIWIPKKCSQKYHKFSPKCRRENIFWSSCSSYDNLSDEQSLYKYICPEGWDTWLTRMSGTFTNDMELNTLS